MQPWWVQIAVKHLNSPSVGWVTTTSSSAKIVPPPTGMSEVCERVRPDPAARAPARRLDVAAEG